MLRDKLNEGELLLFDGAMGTLLQEQGLKGGELPERYNIEKREQMEAIHLSYLEAGSNIITTNTFGANALKMGDLPYSVEELVVAGVENAKAAIAKSGKDAYVALDIGPIGQLMAPMGNLAFDEAYELIAEQVKAGFKAGCDLVLFETISDIYELKAGVLAVKENSDLPVFASMTFEEGGRTLTGTSPEVMVTVLEGLGVDAVGLNCSLGPIEMKPVVDRILEIATIPVLVQPNAGLPEIEDGHTVFKIGAEEFKEACIPFLESGVAIIGGCCGTRPSYIKEISNWIEGKMVVPREVKRKTRVASFSQVVTIGEGFTIIGERINPTGKKKLKEALRNNDNSYIISEAMIQEEHGAQILDVNVGLPEIDEEGKMVEVLSLLTEVTTLPLQIDSSSVEAIEAGCRYYNGKPLVNSVNGKEESLESILPIVKKYGGSVIGLTLDEKGIPEKAEERLAIAERIMKRAMDYGIPKEDVIIDCLVLTASAQQKEVMETIKAVRGVHEVLGLKTSLGVSNVSFGLPARPLINRTFLVMGMTVGLDVAIINPMSEDMMSAIAAFKVLSYEDVDSIEFIEGYGDTGVEVKSVQKAVTDYTLEQVVISGLKNMAADKTRVLLETTDPLTIINESLMPALNKVGADFEAGKLFLPQLIQSAETVKNAFTVLKEVMKNSDEEEVKKGRVLLATVEGDIHDIGKNIVKVLMENYGYEVLDLGKDVPVSEVVKIALEEKVDVVGLSALMTTTVKNMEATIEALKEAHVDVPVIVGGAVLNQSYADMIGADFYGKDARASVKIVEKIMAEKK